jgi:hypothetical protein
MQPRKKLKSNPEQVINKLGAAGFIGNRIRPIQSFQNVYRPDYGEFICHTLRYQRDISSYSLAIADEPYEDAISRCPK